MNLETLWLLLANNIVVSDDCMEMLYKLNMTLGTAFFMRLSDGLSYKTQIFYETPYWLKYIVFGYNRFIVFYLSLLFSSLPPIFIGKNECYMCTSA
jgi:hypothetical protein